MSRKVECHIIEVTYPNGSHKAGATVFEGGIVATAAHILKTDSVFVGLDIQDSDFYVVEGRDLAFAHIQDRTHGLKAAAADQTGVGVSVIAQRNGKLRKKDALVFSLPEGIRQQTLLQNQGVIFHHGVNPVEYGDCGYPVVDDQNNVVGIVVARSLGRAGFYERITEADLQK